MTDASPSPTVTLEDLLHPLDVETFVAENLGRRAVYIPGDAARFSKLLSRDSFFDLVDNPKSDVFIGNVDKDRRFHQFVIDNSRARSMLACGFSLQVEELHLLDQGLMELANNVREALGLHPAMEAAALLSPPDKGYPVHIDANPDVWIIQIHGSKRWRYSKERATENPLSWAMATADKAWGGDRWDCLEKPDEREFSESVLTPGDVLYFPGGTWHATQALEESLSVIIASVNSTWPDFFFSVLRDKLLERPQWRNIPAERGNDMQAVLRSRLDELQEMIGTVDAGELDKALVAAREKRRRGAYRQNEG